MKPEDLASSGSIAFITLRHVRLMSTSGFILAGICQAGAEAYLKRLLFSGGAEYDILKNEGAHCRANCVRDADEIWGVDYPE